ncbi:MAG: TetR family transcriptional regulator [Proteobacteria bacterium]|nr:TetR family transcriptional regulator [Pseudomonadota bacterium]
MLETNPNPNLDEILIRSARLMAHRGYHGTSMRDLAEVTGRSLSGLYHYFEGKEDLLYLINKQGFTSLLDLAEDLREAGFGPTEMLKGLISRHIGFFVDHLDEMRVMMFGTLELSKDRGREINRLKEVYRQNVQKIVQAYIAEARGSGLSEVELARKTYLLFGMMNWIFGWYSSGAHGTPEDLADDIFRTFTEGCAAG